ncbi:acyl-CoA dehydrogenase family protein [Solibacillus cecembensis]|uniref:acyl-CoA dehydrogenase family protein n=1 Tax=Solibacillus cecembensis TaxID=459347 RepID=UPI003D05387E
MAIDTNHLQQIIGKKLKPVVKKVDEQAHYAEDYILALSEAGFFNSAGKEQATILQDGAAVVRETAKVCMTTAFCIWCHLAALTYLRTSKNEHLQAMILPKLEQGELLGATGLSNPMKHYSGLEELLLTARQTAEGYMINGVLPAVSNLGNRHYFGAIAALGDRDVMVLVSTNTPGLELKEKVGFIGVNGSATYTCKFNQVFIPTNQVIAEDARAFCDEIRPTFIYYQIPLGLGVIAAAGDGIEKVKAKQNGCNDYLQVQARELFAQYDRLNAELEHAARQVDLKEVVNIRLETVQATLAAVQANMMHNGAAGYVAGSVASRKLREAYFFANLTPTVRHLEKLRASF